MKKTPLRSISEKQKEKNKEWALVKAMKQSQSRKCEHCGLSEGAHELWIFDCHHRDGNRNNNSYSNAVILHRTCHGLLHDGHIKLEARNERTG